jgi:curli biogenesis system outer membrane secretion channel CsgG
MIKKLLSGFLMLVVFNVTAQKKVVQTQSQIQETTNEVQVLKRIVAIGRFTNETQYAKGIFFDKNNDPLQKQTIDILSAKLASSNKFILLERQDLDKVLSEVQYSNNESYQKIGADYLIVGSITEFGRKNVGGVGVFSRSKTQTVQAGVSVRLIDVSTGQIIYAEEAKGEAETTNKTVMGLGKQTDFDATLSDKAISAAISKLVENIINNCMDRPWKSYILSHDENGILISGGKSQGIKIGDVYEVVQKGKSVKNPQTNMIIELPGKTVGKISVEFSGGDNPQSEFSMVSFVEGSVDPKNLNNYYIKQIK